MIWLLVAAVLALIAWVWVWSTGPAFNDLDDPRAIPQMLALLLSRGVHKAGVRGSLTICERSAPKRRLILTKYIREVGAAGFAAQLPSEPWSEPLYNAFRAALDQYGIKYREVGTPPHTSIECDLARDFGGAYMVARLLFEDTMGLKLARDCVAYYRNVVLSNRPDLTGVDADKPHWL